MKRTQRQRAEEWAAASCYLRDDGAIMLRHVIVGETGQFRQRHVDAIRRALVATWMRARRVR